MRILLALSLLTLAHAEDKPAVTSGAAPTVADALARRTAQLSVANAKAELDRILKDPVVIRAQAAILSAQQALDAVIKQHPGCELQEDNAWKCQIEAQDKEKK